MWFNRVERDFYSEKFLSTLYKRYGRCNMEKIIYECKGKIDAYYNDEKNPLSLERMFDLYNLMEKRWKNNEEYLSMLVWALMAPLITLLLDNYLHFINKINEIINNVKDLFINAENSLSLGQKANILFMVLSHILFVFLIFVVLALIIAWIIKKSVDNPVRTHKDKIYHYIVLPYEIKVIKEKIKNDYGIDVE